jgi:hypothetical protein
LEVTKDGKFAWVSSIGSLVAATSALSILLSVLYEFGYYRLGTGISIPAIPTAMNDHIKACFMWLPIAIGMVATAFLTILTLNAKKTLNRIASNNENNNLKNLKLHNLQKVPAIFLILSALITICLFIFSVPHYYLWASLGWMFYYIILFVASFFSDIFIKGGNYSSNVYTSAIIFSNIIIFFIASGYINARSEIETVYYKYEISLKNESAPKIKANILRSYDKVTFFVYSSQKLVFMQNDQIKMVLKN